MTNILHHFTMDSIRRFISHNEASILLFGIFILNLSLICVPFMQRWSLANDSSQLSTKYREVLIFSLALSVTEVLSYITKMYVEPRKFVRRVILVFTASAANGLLLILKYDSRIAILGLSLKILFSMYLCFLNLYSVGNSLSCHWIFKMMVLYLTLAISTSSWLHYSTQDFEIVFGFCYALFGLSFSIFTYVLYLWLRKICASIQEGFVVEQLQNTVNLITLYVIGLSQIILVSVYCIRKDLYCLNEYYSYSMLIVSISMHLAWFCQNQISQLEKTQTNVRTYYLKCYSYLFLLSKYLYIYIRSD